jgi:hypothetical protein
VALRESALTLYWVDDLDKPRFSTSDSGDNSRPGTIAGYADMDP